MPSLLSRNKTFVMVVKIYAEVVIKVFYFCPIVLDFFTLFQIFFIYDCNFQNGLNPLVHNVPK